MFEMKIIREYNLFTAIQLLYADNEVDYNDADFSQIDPRDFFRRYNSILYNDYIKTFTEWAYLPANDPELLILTSLIINDNGTYKTKDNLLNDVFKLFVIRNWYNYCLRVESHEELPFIELRKRAVTFFTNLLSILEMTQQRYLKLLDMYQATTTELLAKLQRSSSGSADNKTFTNLTPQTPSSDSEDWFDYVNSAVKSLATASDTTSEDKDYLIDKINSIQEKYRNVLKDWSNELDKLCWESD